MILYPLVLDDFTTLAYWKGFIYGVIVSIHPRKFSEGDLVLLWDQAKEPLGAGKFNPMWDGPYVVNRVLEKGAYELVDYEGTTLQDPRNGFYIKKYYA